MKTNLHDEMQIRQHAYFSKATLVSALCNISYLIFSYFMLTKYYASIYKEEMTYNQVIQNIFNPFTLALAIWLNVFYITIYYLEHPFFEQFKVNKIDWPWKENPKHFKRILPGAIKAYLINSVSFFFYMLALGIFAQPALSLNKLPSFGKYVYQIFMCILLEDFFFYWGHRLLHHPLLYARVHKKHHEFYNTIHISCIDTHWFEFLASNIIPLFSSIFVLKGQIHMVTFMSFFWIRVSNTHGGHSGYDFPWVGGKEIPGTMDSAYHSFHHLKNVGNYASFFRFWDTLFGTNKYYLDSLEE